MPIKYVMLVDKSTEYMVDAERYLVSSTQTDEKRLGEYFGKNMCRSIHGTNRIITMGTGFTSLPLAKELLKELYKLTFVGTLRGNKRNIPVELHNNWSRRTAMFCHDKELTLLS